MADQVRGGSVAAMKYALAVLALPLFACVAPSDQRILDRLRVDRPVAAPQREREASASVPVVAEVAPAAPQVEPKPEVVTEKSPADMTDKELSRALTVAETNGRDYRFRSLRREYAKRQWTWSSEIRWAVGSGNVLVGMTHAQVQLAWGVPSDINTTTTKYGVSEQWCYGSLDEKRRFVYFDNRKVTAISE